MHYIADDLDMDAWVKAGLTRLERYLASWRLFEDLYPADATYDARFDSAPHSESRAAPEAWGTLRNPFVNPAGVDSLRHFFPA